MGRRAWALLIVLLTGCAFTRAETPGPEPVEDPVESLPAVLESMIYTGELSHTFSYQADMAHPFPASFREECQEKIEAVTRDTYNAISREAMEYTGFYDGISYHYSFTSLPDGEILNFTCTVTLKTEEAVDQETLQEQLVYCESEVEAIIAGLYEEGALTDGMEIREQALALYRYVDERLAYDTSYSSRTLYETLVTDTAVCEGYTALFSALCHELDIPVCSVFGESEGKNHVWSAIDVAGTRYYIDATWGDPLPDRKGFSEEKWFWLTWDELTALDPQRAITREGSLEEQ